MTKSFKFLVIFFISIIIITISIPFIKDIKKVVIEDFFNNQKETKIETVIFPDEFKLCNTDTGEIFTLNKDDFLLGSLICEMSSSVPTEALKAQVVASYSYYCYLLQQNPEYIINYSPKNKTVYTDPNTLETDELAIYKNALDQVENQVLVYENTAACASFFNISSGFTESAKDLWGQDLPYLISVASPYDSFAYGNERVFQFSKNEVQTRLNKKWDAKKFDFSIDCTQWFSDIKYTLGGAVTSMNICGFSLTGSEFSSCFGINSPCFKIEFKNDIFVITCCGEGSLVGMSQTNAVYMAAEGATYKEILSWYFPNTQLMKKI